MKPTPNTSYLMVHGKTRALQVSCCGITASNSLQLVKNTRPPPTFVPGNIASPDKVDNTSLS